jgi:hypothetical protein
MAAARWVRNELPEDLEARDVVAGDEDVEVGAPPSSLGPVAGNEDSS